MKEDLSNLKVGDKVFDTLLGWGKVKKLTPNEIWVNLDEAVGGFPFSITFDYQGKAHSRQNRRLFTYNPFEKNEFPKWMECYVNSSKWEKRVALFKGEKGYLTASDMEMDWSNLYWISEENTREIASNELTIKEIEEKLGISNLKIVK